MLLLPHFGKSNKIQGPELKPGTIPMELGRPPLHWPSGCSETSLVEKERTLGLGSLGKCPLQAIRRTGCYFSLVHHTCAPSLHPHGILASTVVNTHMGMPQFCVLSVVPSARLSSFQDIRDPFSLLSQVTGLKRMQMDVSIFFWSGGLKFGIKTHF
jgi:hypothetical protein